METIKNIKKQEALNYLIDALGENPEKLRFYINVVHVSQSGMSRDIKFYIIRDNTLLNLTYNIS